MTRSGLPWLSLCLVVACSAPPGRPSETASDGNEPRYGVVDLERVLAETRRGRQARREFENLERQAGEQLQQIRAQLEAKAEELGAAQNEGTSEEDLANMVAEYQQMVQQAQQAQGVLQGQLEQAREALTQPILEDTARVARNIGREGGYALILELKAAPYVMETSDLTDQIIEELERQGSLSSEGSLLGDLAGSAGTGDSTEDGAEDAGDPESAEEAEE
ncbi:MAG: OmpH family outer membrane protein [Myxococcota bacterium]